MKSETTRLAERYAKRQLRKEARLALRRARFMAKMLRMARSERGQIIVIPLIYGKRP